MPPIVSLVESFRRSINPDALADSFICTCRRFIQPREICAHIYGADRDGSQTEMVHRREGEGGLIASLMEIIVMKRKNGGAFGRFDVNEISKSIPPTAETLLLDAYLIDEEARASGSC